MKVTREQAQENRERVIDAAARLFREKGFYGIGVADLMKSAGLTHGGFYGQFSSKDDLAAAACARALAETDRRWQRLMEKSADPLPEIVASYLSTTHRDHPEKGCALVALGGEVSRSEAPVRQAYTSGLRALIDRLAQLLPGRTKGARRDRALAAMATLVGAQLLARAVDDDELSEEILAAARAAI